jgi:hypothetical protein
MVTEWADCADDGFSRRVLLLKLSTSLSMAALSPVAIDKGEFISYCQPLNTSPLSGIWRSSYVYTSTDRAGDFTDNHYVVFRQHENRLVGQSLPHSTGSQLRIELVLEPPVATGSWFEMTSPNGYYKGATYHGTLQMIIDPSGRSMRGMWLGFSRNFTINSGRWDLILEESSVTKTTQRTYCMKV